MGSDDKNFLQTWELRKPHKTTRISTEPILVVRHHDVFLAYPRHNSYCVLKCKTTCPSMDDITSGVTRRLAPEFRNARFK